MNDLTAHHKLLATVLFVFAVVATPHRQVWAFGLHALVVVVAAAIARVPARSVARRLTIELPFVAFAFLLPVMGHGPRVDVLSVSLSQPGLWAAWSIVVKGTLGVAASALLVATTPVVDIVAGLERLHVPRLFVAVMSFMIRYGHVVSLDLRRMKVARESRAHDPRWFWHARALATTAGTVFVRSYERGERVYLAMQARGHDGSMSRGMRRSPTPPRSWWCLVVPGCAVLVCSVAWMSHWASR